MECLTVCSDGDVGSLGCWSCEQGGDMGSKRLQWVRRLCIIVREEQVSYTVVKRIVEASFALEGISLA